MTTNKKKKSLKDKLSRKPKTVKAVAENSINQFKHQMFKEGQSFDLVLTGIKEYDKNPRKAKNPAYESLYLSIKTRGVRDKLAVTLRPDEETYMLAAGGNTRLQILSKLFEETGDEIYNNVKVFFTEYESELKIYLDHLSENDDSGDLVFIDRSLAVREIQSILENELDKKLTTTELSKLLTKKGYDGAGKSVINDMMYAVDFLEPVIPALLREHTTKSSKTFGMGSRLVAEIRKTYNKSLKGFLIKSVESDAKEWQAIFYQALAKQNKNSSFEIEDLKSLVVKVLADGDKEKEIEIALEVFKNKKAKKPTESSSSENEDNKIPTPKSDSEDVKSDPSLSDNTASPLNEGLTAITDDIKGNKPSADKYELMTTIYQRAVQIALGSKIEGLVEEFDNGVGYKLLDFNNDGLDSHDLSIWWLLFSLSKMYEIPEKLHDSNLDYFKLFNKHKELNLEFWSEFSKGLLTFEIMSNALSIYIDCADKAKLKELHQLEQEIFNLLDITNDKIWIDS